MLLLVSLMIIWPFSYSFSLDLYYIFICSRKLYILLKIICLKVVEIVLFA
jgi:hypothetical protein